MMKLLITGMNKNQCNRKFYLNQNLKVVPSQYSLFNCLVDMGYDVEQRVVNLGEDLSIYDKVIVYLASPKQIVTSYFYNGLYTISKRKDCILAFDDWQLSDLHKSIINHEEDSKLFCEFLIKNQNDKNISVLIKKYKTDIKDGIHQIIKKENKVLISAFSTLHLDDNYGKKILYQGLGYDDNKIYTYNPNPYHRNRKPGDFLDEGKEDFEYIEELCFTSKYIRPTKQKQFNFASLVQSSTEKWLKKQGFVYNLEDTEKGYINTWPVELYGSRKKSQKRLTEEHICQVYDRDWAALMPGYFHSGSGWWRARPLQVADCESILVGDKKELDVYYGSDFKFNSLVAKEITELQDYELKNIAISQKNALYSNHPLNKNTQIEEISLVLRG